MDVVEKTVTGMAKYIDREALVEWLKRIPLKSEISDCFVSINQSHLSFLLGH